VRFRIAGLSKKRLGFVRAIIKAHLSRYLNPKSALFGDILFAVGEVAQNSVKHGHDRAIKLNIEFTQYCVVISVTSRSHKRNEGPLRLVLREAKVSQKKRSSEPIALKEGAIGLEAVVDLTILSKLEGSKMILVFALPCAISTGPGDLLPGLLYRS